MLTPQEIREALIDDMRCAWEFIHWPPVATTPNVLRAWHKVRRDAQLFWLTCPKHMRKEVNAYMRSQEVRVRTVDTVDVAG